METFAYPSPAAIEAADPGALGDGLTIGPQTQTLFVQVRILVPQPPIIKSKT
jgi:hypothetical protein